jgi:hypothetical protein
MGVWLPWATPAAEPVGHGRDLGMGIERADSLFVLARKGRKC